MARTTQRTYTPGQRQRQQEREATRANPRRSARVPKNEAGPSSAPVSKQASEAPKPVSGASKKATQAPRKRQKKEEPSGSSEKPTETEEEAAALARAKVAWAKTKGRRGHLKMVVEMPFDLLLEVLGFMHPGDLLHLSMTTKSMRGLIMDKSLALPLWKAAFERVEPQPPPCPEEVSLPQWANFLYARTCFNCKATQGLERCWGALVRLCKKCLAVDFNIKFVWDEQDIIRKLLRDMVPSKYLKNPGDSRRYNYWYNPHYEKHKIALEAMSGNKAKMKEYSEREKERNQRWSMLQWSGGGSSWEYKMKGVKVAELDARRTGREQALMERVEALGFGKLLERLPPRSRSTLPGFGGTKPLTEKEWTKLCPLLIDTLEELQKTFQNEDWKRMIVSRTNMMIWVYLYFISRHRDMEPYAPQKRGLALCEPFKSIIYDTPPETAVGHKEFLDHLEEFPAILNTWREEADNVLLSLLPQPASEESKKGKAKAALPDRSVLSLGTTIFTCMRCQQPLTYPVVLSHDCLYRSSAKNRSDDEDEGEENDQEDEAEGEDQGVADPNHPWNVGHDQVDFDELASVCAAGVIKTLGEDPATATWEDLDKANKRVECVRCRKDKGLKRTVMDWRNAILHEFEKHGDESKPDIVKWELLDDESLAVAYAKEKATKNNANVRPVDDSRRCTVCEQLIINEEGNVAYARRWGATPRPLPGETACPQGHDLTVEGAVYDSAWTIPFKSTPRPVKIA